MKSRKVDGNDIRRILIGMVTDRVVLSRIASQWQGSGLFNSRWANLVGGWCIGHLEKYGEAPGRSIESMFDTWSAKTQVGEKTIQLVERFLHVVSDEYESQEKPLASDYLLDLAGAYFNRVKLRRILDDASEDVDAGCDRKAFDNLVGMGRVELGTGALIKPGEDFDVWVDVFDAERQRPLVGYPGPLHNFLGSALVRDRLFAFMAPDKTGKTFWIIDLAFRAVMNRCRVAYFEAGDLGKEGVLLRLGERASKRPRKRGRLLIPSGFDNQGEVLHKKKHFTEGLTYRQCFHAFKRACHGRDVFRLSCHPKGTLSVSGIQSMLRDWEREKWVADVVVIDYADILAPPFGVRDKLDQIDETWIHLGRLSQEMHCLVVTATQSNAAAYGEKQRVLGRRHFSGRKTKLAHVDGMLALNVSPDDKLKGITRVNWIVKRYGYFSEKAWVTVAGCLDLANPAMKSFLRSHNRDGKEDDD